MSTSVSHHLRHGDFMESNAYAYDVDTPVEFHTLELSIKGSFGVVLYFKDKIQMINALNDLRLTCENKIWELNGMPEYDNSAEPF